MKKLFIILAAAAMAVSVNAAKGDMVLSGGLGLDITNVSPEEGDGVTATSFDMSPSFTYFLSNKFGVGGRVLFNSFDLGEDFDAVNTFGVGVFVRYYVMQTEKFGIFGQAGLDFRFPEDATQITLGVSPGVQYFINKKWSVEISLNNLLYLDVMSAKDAGSVTNFGLSLNPNDARVFENPLESNNPFAVGFAPLNLTVNYHF